MSMSTMAHLPCPGVGSDVDDSEELRLMVRRRGGVVNVRPRASRGCDLRRPRGAHPSRAREESVHRDSRRSSGEDVPCLHAYPGYAANWKRPTNDTRTGIRSGPRLLPSDQSTPTIWSQRLRAAGFEGTFRACFSRAKFYRG